MENDIVGPSNVRLIREFDIDNQLYDHLMLSHHAHIDKMLEDLYDLYRSNYNRTPSNIAHNQAFSWEKKKSQMFTEQTLKTLIKFLNTKQILNYCEVFRETKNKNYGYLQGLACIRTFPCSRSRPQVGHFKTST